MPLHFFGSTSTISRFGERFRDGQHSIVSFLFSVFLLTVPPVPSHLLKWGARVPPCPGVEVGGVVVLATRVTTFPLPINVLAKTFTLYSRVPIQYAQNQLFTSRLYNELLI